MSNNELRGRIVLYKDGNGKDRVAVITKQFSSTMVNLFVFKDGSDDYGDPEPPFSLVTSVAHSSTTSGAGPCWSLLG